MSPLVEINTASRIHSASIDRDGEAHYSWYLLKRVRGREVERQDVMAVGSGVSVCVCRVFLCEWTGLTEKRGQIEIGKGKRKRENRCLSEPVSFMCFHVFIVLSYFSYIELCTANDSLKIFIHTCGSLFVFVLHFKIYCICSKIKQKWQSREMLASWEKLCKTD